jgi:hypothetical protein
MKTPYKKIIVALVLVSITGIALAWRVNHITALKKAPVKKTDMGMVAPIPYDHALLDTFSKVTALMDIRSKPSTYSGTVNIADAGDSSQNVHQMPFLLSSKLNECYYRCGHTETLNSKGFYLYIDHDQQRILVGAQKPVSVIGMGGITDLKADMINEHYTLDQRVQGQTRTIRFINEQHVACREYALSYDTAAMKIKKIYLRLPDMNYGMNTKKEKTIDISFAEWSDKADIDKFLRVKDIIEVEGTTISLKNKYRSYHLIRIH